MEEFVKKIDVVLSKIYGCDIKESLLMKKKIINEICHREKEDILDYLIILVDDNFRDGILKEKDKEEIFDILSNEKVAGYDSIYSLNKRIEWLRTMELDYLTIGLKESHKQIMNIFDNLNLLLNKADIDYYHTSGILVYLLTNNPLERYHHDLDIFVNEKDISKLETALNGTDFAYDMFLGKRTEDTKRRTLKLKYNKSDIVVSVFIFEKLLDGSVIINDYYYDSNNNLFATQDYNSPRCVQLSFSDEIYEHNGIPYKSITKEALYNCKKNRGIKHQYDCNILKPHIDLKLENEIDIEMKSNLEAFPITDEAIKKQMKKLLKV